MRQYIPRLIFLLAVVLLFPGCRPTEKTTKSDSKGKAKEAVKEIVTKDFKLHEQAKRSLNESEEKSKAQLETIDRELKQ